MPASTPGASEFHGPTAVGLTRLTRRLSFTPGGEVLYRHILHMVDLGPEGEFLVVPCGRGASALFVARTTGAAGAGTDPDPVLVEFANQRAKTEGAGGRLHFETAPSEDLPYQDAVFDLVLGEIELGAARDAAAAVQEIARVTRPGGRVVLMQLVWTRTLEPDRAEELVRKLGVRPQRVVEWKRLLGEAGITEIAVEDWSDAAVSRDQPSVLGGLAELFTIPGKLRLLPRAWERWGWKGVRALLSGEHELRSWIAEDRVLGVSLMTGRRALANDRRREENGDRIEE